MSSFRPIHRETAVLLSPLADERPPERHLCLVVEAIDDLDLRARSGSSHSSGSASDHPSMRPENDPLRSDRIADRRAPIAALDRSLARGLELRVGFHPSPFGEALLLAGEHGLAGLGFVDRERETALDDFRRRWPKARFVADDGATAPLARRVFDPAEWRTDPPQIALIGSPFDLDVWRLLLEIAPGATATYGEIARRLGRPSAARAIGGAVGRNPIAFVVPCHRVVGAGGALTGYHWGLARKQAMLAFERAPGGEERA